MNALLRAEARWLHNGRCSAAIIPDASDKPLCVLVRHRDPASGVDETKVYMPETLWKASPGYDGTGNYTEINQLLADVTEMVRGAMED